MSVASEAHPWNREFAWTDHPGPFDRVTPAQARAYDTDGAFLLEGALDRATLAAVVGAIDPLEGEVRRFLEAQPEGRFSIAGLDTVTIAVHLAARAAVLAATCRSLGALAGDLVGPDARLYWDQAVYKQPHSAEPVLWHQDNGYTYVEPQAYLTCWIALTDATVDNGCVWVLPGVHRAGTLAHRDTPIGFQCFEDPPGAVPIEARAGDIVVFSSLTPHATGYNHTDEVRKAYIVQFAPDGAVALRGDPHAGPGRPEAQDEPARQFVVWRAGRAVTG